MMRANISPSAQSTHLPLSTHQLDPETLAAAAMSQPDPAMALQLAQQEMDYRVELFNK